MRVVKDKDRKIRVEMDIDDNFDDTLPPVRSTKDAVNAIDALKSIKSKPQKITSFDYQQWDKYDAGISSQIIFIYCLISSIT